MFKISKEFHFSASHVLKDLPTDHPCSRLHGHNYVIIAEFRSSHLDHVGFVVDYRKLQPIKDFIDDHLDHYHLNDVVKFNPTAENLAVFLFDIFKETFRETLYAIEVKETPKTRARYSPYE